MKRLILAAIALSLLGSCEKSRVDVMAASKDELASRCFDAAAGNPDPAWVSPRLGEKIAVAKHRDGFDITCPFTLRDGRYVPLKVVVACPADTAVPCRSFAAQ